MKRRVWLIYDLGFDGDYKRLYNWLDEQEAKECVVGGATFEYDFASNGDNRDEMFDELKNIIPVNIDENPSTRIYAITTVQDGIVGRFIYGNRKTAPWFGSNHHETDEEDG